MMPRMEVWLQHVTRGSWQLATTLLVGAFVLACGHTDVTGLAFRPLGAAKGPAALYLKGMDHPSVAQVVGMVQATGFGSEAEAEAVTQALAQRAGAMGCDAVVRVEMVVGQGRANAVGVCVLLGTAGPSPRPADSPTQPGS